MAETRLDTLFGKLAASKKKALVVYLCVGDPSVEETIELARAAIESGADIIELGVPFSDPSADGPAIARASERALKEGGGGLPAALKVAEAIRKGSNAGIVLFGYYNPIFVFGESKLVDEATRAGIDALLVVDLPIEEAKPLRQIATPKGLAVIPLVAPTTPPARLQAVAEAAKNSRLGFVYYVSVAGVTGSAALKPEEAAERAAAIKDRTGLPVVIGFGIDSGEKARASAVGADGVVVGTAIVKEIEAGSGKVDRLDRVKRLVTTLRKSLDAP